MNLMPKCTVAVVLTGANGALTFEQSALAMRLDLVQLLVGPPGSAAQNQFHQQVTPATLWTVNHSLNKRPQVTVLSPGGVEIEALITHISLSQFTVSFNTPQAGLAEFI